MLILRLYPAAQVLPCSKRYCHDWTTCPFAHPGAPELLHLTQR